NGVFTAAVLDGLHGEAKATDDGWITVRTLADFVQQRVAVWVRHNRPDHIAKSFGITLQVEATAKDLPLAPHPEAIRDRRLYHGRREAALRLATTKSSSAKRLLRLITVGLTLAIAILPRYPVKGLRSATRQTCPIVSSSSQPPTPVQPIQAKGQS